MPVKVLVQIKDDEQRKKFLTYLEGERFSVIEDTLADIDEYFKDAIAKIVSEKPTVVLADYLAEDAISVKVLQEISDLSPETRFIFIDSSGNTDPENMMMAFNEGARAFLPLDIQQVPFLNYITRAIEGPGRLRHEASTIAEADLQALNEKISRIKSYLLRSEKLITYLLSTPLSAQFRKVLILSDSGYQREILKKHLEDNNFIVITAAKFDEAVAMTLSEKPRIVISDYGLEDGKNGIDFCKTLKFTNKYVPCYFIVCTASEDKESIVMQPGNGVDDCLLKPASASALNEFLARVAQGLLL